MTKHYWVGGVAYEPASCLVDRMTLGVEGKARKPSLNTGPHRKRGR